MFETGQVSPWSSVALRLMTPLLIRWDGRLRINKLNNAVLRGALLVDCALAGSLRDEPEQIVLADSMTGFAAADQLLQRIRQRPDRPLERWLLHGLPPQRALAEQLVAIGRCELTRSRLGRARYLAAARSPADSQWLREIAIGSRDAEPRDTATAALAALLGLVEDLPFQCEPAVISRCGNADWLVQTTIEATRPLVYQARAVTSNPTFLYDFDLGH